jgi:hypothetical protein
MFIWSKNFSHPVYEKSEVKMAEIDFVKRFNTIFPN